MSLDRPRLIVNADDFGYTPGVNRAIFDLHRAGALSSATLMAGGPALEEALVAWADSPAGAERPGRELGIGCHVVLVDGAPILSGEELPSLARRGTDLPREQPGRSREHWVGPQQAAALFRPTLGGFVADLLRGLIRESEIEQEAVAQIRRLQARGIRVTHLDTHKHTHMFPRVLRPVLRAALQCGVKAIRNPFEPAWSLRATPGALLVRRAEMGILRMLRPEFARLVAEAGLRTTAGAIGVLATGTLDAVTLERLLQAARLASEATDDAWELVCHPAYVDAALAAMPTRLLASREIERAALASVVPGRQDFALIHFGQLSD